MVVHTGTVLLDVDALKRHRDAIQVGDNGPFVAGALTALMAHAHIERAKGSDEFDELNKHVRATMNRRGDLWTIASKLDWMLEQRDAGALDSFAWMYFASSDVNAFLFNVRSLFDHLAEAMRVSAPRPHGIPHQSFKDLQVWIAKHPDMADKQLGAEVASIVAATDWFLPLRQLRNELTHYDGQTIVFPETPGIAVGLWNRRLEDLIDEPALKDDENENLLRFERLASATMARLHALVEDSAQAIADANGYVLELNAWSTHPGLEVVARWTDEYLAAL